MCMSSTRTGNESQGLYIHVCMYMLYMYMHDVFSHVLPVCEQINVKAYACIHMGTPGKDLLLKIYNFELFQRFKCLKCLKCSGGCVCPDSHS